MKARYVCKAPSSGVRPSRRRPPRQPMRVTGSECASITATRSTAPCCSWRCGTSSIPSVCPRADNPPDQIITRSKIPIGGERNSRALILSPQAPLIVKGLLFHEGGKHVACAPSSRTPRRPYKRKRGLVPIAAQRSVASYPRCKRRLHLRYRPAVRRGHRCRYADQDQLHVTRFGGGAGCLGMLVSRRHTGRQYRRYDRDISRRRRIRSAASRRQHAEGRGRAGGPRAGHLSGPAVRHKDVCRDRRDPKKPLTTVATESSAPIKTTVPSWARSRLRRPLCCVRPIWFRF